MRTSNLFSAHTLDVTRSAQRARRAPNAVLRMLMLLVALFAVASMQSAYAASARTIVSLTFDDGLTQSAVGAILRSRAMKATFYVNANLIGSGGGYLTKAELDALFADGHEIGGHTTNHVDLATLSDAAQRTAICGDLQTLNTWYPNQIHSFAYPFASIGPTTQSIVAAGCTGVGTYSSARTVGGLVSGNQCTGCATSETIPPGNPYYINSP
ncbi:MAG: polysaccharide deacetylase family protein, partial [Burkholderiaceae bacterium]